MDWSQNLCKALQLDYKYRKTSEIYLGDAYMISVTSNKRYGTIFGRFLYMELFSRGMVEQQNGMISVPPF